MKKSKKKSDSKALLCVITVLVCILLALVGTIVYLAFDKLGMLNYDSGIGGDPDITFNYSDENMNFQPISDIADAESIKELVKSWATNGGDKIHSDKVVNVLLIGEDNEDGSHRSDSCILVSINTETEEITLTSFLRDSYSYMNIAGQDRFDKTNHAYSWGGAAKLMEVLSDNYKIRIDHYVSIGYESFVSAINDLGGIRVDVTQAEADYMNRTTNMKGFVSGENVLLDGEHALVFARIRKLDGEPERTERQRRLIAAFINSIKDSSMSDVNNAIDRFLPYVTTNFSKSEILSLGTRAITDGWLKYEVVSQVAPSEANRAGFSGYPTYTGNLDVWIVDYIKAARELQLSIYKTTNITVNEATHVSAIDLAFGTTNTGSDAEQTTQEEQSDGWFDYTADYSFGYPFEDFTIPNQPDFSIPFPDVSIPDITIPNFGGGYQGGYQGGETTTVREEATKEDFFAPETTTENEQ